MKRFLLSPIVLLLISLSWSSSAQKYDQHILDSIFAKNGEVYFKFNIQDRDEITYLTSIISIDNVKGNQVFAYANRKELDRFIQYNPDFTLLPNPGSLLNDAELNTGGARDGLENVTAWDFYPTYEQYVGYMTGFVSAYPGLCKLDTVGTSMQGRLILALRISKNISQEEAEPQFLYTSSIHGDETTGYVLMLHLIDYLLSGYGTDPTATDLLNTTEIVINPLANPDGTYHGGNGSVSGSVRYNANGIDLNRNFPDPEDGQHPDGNPWQVETQAWMDYADLNHFTMSANFHGGAEVFNYPWDTWAKLAADDAWWEFVGREWADTVHVYGPSGYFTFMNNGVTNGYAWYTVSGGRQDYMNYYHRCREVTLEISDVKTLPASLLSSFWEYNFHSFLNYMQEANYGFNGIVTDTVTDQPIAAKVYISLHDKDFSEVYSTLPTGFYARPIYEGTYNVTFSAPGYFTKTVKNVGVSKLATTELDVQLRPLTFDLQDKVVNTILVYPNPTDGNFSIVFPDDHVNPSCSIQVINMLGTIVYSSDINPGPDTKTAEIKIPGIQNGLYFLKFNSGYRIYLDKLIISR
jgi:hypothetical protein